MKRFVALAIALYAAVPAWAQNPPVNNPGVFITSQGGGGGFSSLCSGTGFTLTDSSDTTKKIQCNASGITTGNTITIYIGGTAASPTFGGASNQWATIYVLNLSDGTASIALGHNGAIPVFGPAGGNAFYIPGDIVTGNYDMVFNTANSGTIGMNASGRIGFSNCGTNAVSDACTLDTYWLKDHVGGLRVVSSTAIGTPTSCGTSPSASGNDSIGTMTVGTSPSTTCTLVFGGTWTAAPVCSFYDKTHPAIVFTYTEGTTTVPLTASGTLTAADVINYRCEKAN